MSEQEQANQEEEVVAHAPDQEEAAMQAAIAESRGQDPQESPEPTQPEQGGSQPETDAPSFLAGMTEEQVKALLAKAGEVDELKAQVRNVFGRYGELNSKLQQLTKTESVAQADESTEELARKYHEALLEGDVELASKLFVQTRRGNGDAAATNAQGLSEALTQQEQKFEGRILRMRHPDWDVVTKTNDFALWQQTLPEADRQTLATSWDALYIAEKIDGFKAWKAKSSEQAAQTDQQRQQRTRRLENAVTPQGTGHAVPPVVTEEEAMQAAIRARIRPRVPTI